MLHCRMPGSMWHGFCFACAVTLIFLSTQVCSQCYRPTPRMSGLVNFECCTDVSNTTISDIVDDCHVQEPYGYCGVKAYILLTRKNHTWCVDPAAPWLQGRLRRLEKRGICCKLP